MACVAVIGAQWGDEGKGKIVDYLHGVRRRRRALGGRPERRPHARRRRREARRPPLPERHPARQARSACSRRAWSSTRRAARRDRRARAAAAATGSPSGSCVSDRAHVILPYHVLVDTLREQRQGHRHDQEGHRPVLRRQGAPHRRPCRRSRAISDRLAREGAKPRSRAGRRSSRRSAARCRRSTRSSTPLEPLAEAHRAAAGGHVAARRRRDPKRQAGACSRARRARCSTSITARTRSSRRARRSPAARRSAPASDRTGSTPSSASRRRTRRASAAARSRPSSTTPTASTCARRAPSSARSPVGPRRTGWLDLPALRYAARVNGIDGLALTKLDVLTGLHAHPGVRRVRHSEWSHATISRSICSTSPGVVTPVYEELAGWTETLANARALSDLPVAARTYVGFLQKGAGVPLYLVSVGPRRKETIVLHNPFSGAPSA